MRDTRFNADPTHPTIPFLSSATPITCSGTERYSQLSRTPESPVHVALPYMEYSLTIRLSFSNTHSPTAQNNAIPRPTNHQTTEMPNQQPQEVTNYEERQLRRLEASRSRTRLRQIITAHRRRVGQIVVNLWATRSRSAAITLVRSGGTLRLYRGSVYAVYDTHRDDPRHAEFHVTAKLFDAGGEVLASRGVEVTVPERMLPEELRFREELWEVMRRRLEGRQARGRRQSRGEQLTNGIVDDDDHDGEQYREEVNGDQREVDLSYEGSLEFLQALSETDWGRQLLRRLSTSLENEDSNRYEDDDDFVVWRSIPLDRHSNNVRRPGAPARDGLPEVTREELTELFADADSPDRGTYEPPSPGSDACEMYPDDDEVEGSVSSVPDSDATHRRRSSSDSPTWSRPLSTFTDTPRYRPTSPGDPSWPRLSQEQLLQAVASVPYPEDSPPPSPARPSLEPPPFDAPDSVHEEWLRAFIPTEEGQQFLTNWRTVLARAMRNDPLAEVDENSRREFDYSNVGTNDDGSIRVPQSRVDSERSRETISNEEGRSFARPADYRQSSGPDSRPLPSDVENDERIVSPLPARGGRSGTGSPEYRPTSPVYQPPTDDETPASATTDVDEYFAGVTRANGEGRRDMGRLRRIL